MEGRTQTLIQQKVEKFYVVECLRWKAKVSSRLKYSQLDIKKDENNVEVTFISFHGQRKSGGGTLSGAVKL